MPIELGTARPPLGHGVTLLERAGNLSRSWSGLDLVTQYALAGALVIGLGMGAFGWWVAGRIERGVIEHAAVNAALHLESFVEPVLQELNDKETLGEGAKAALKALLNQSSAGQSVVSITIWNRKGAPVFSTEGSQPRDTAPPPLEVSRALAGRVSNLLFTPAAADGEQKSASVLKIFAPMHRSGTESLIAVAEVHESATALARELRKARYETAGVLALLSIMMAGTLMGIVRKGSQTIEEQKGDLKKRVSELQALLKENEVLQRRVIEANRRSVETNDRFVKRISAELHDGPVQLIALALLRLEGIRPEEPPEGESGEADDDYDAIESALRDALKEIRGMSSGLALPKLDGASLHQAIDYAVKNHERRSRTRVKVEIADSVPRSGSALFLSCIYRFMQEGLNNAYRHAQGKDQAVHALMEGDHLIVEVRDGGPGFTERSAPSDTKGLGLLGLKDRIETMGGEFDIVSACGDGTCLRARFPREALESSAP